MKQGIHPQYHQCQVTCACGNKFVTGSTLEKIEVEVCSKCHPFFTGQQKYIDTKGRIDKFNQKVAQGEAFSAAKEAKAVKTTKKAKTKKAKKSK